MAGYESWVDIIFDDQRDLEYEDINMFPESPEDNPIVRRFVAY
jgi:hypothetical protein